MPLPPSGVTVEDYYATAETYQFREDSQAQRTSSRGGSPVLKQLPSSPSRPGTGNVGPSRPRTASPLGTSRSVASRALPPFLVSGSPYQHLTGKPADALTQRTTAGYFEKDDIYNRKPDLRDLGGPESLDPSTYWIAPGTQTWGRQLSDASQRNRYRESEARAHWQELRTVELDRERKSRPLEWMSGYTGHVPRLRETFAVRNKVASHAVYSPEKTHQRTVPHVQDVHGGQRKLRTEADYPLPGVGFVGITHHGKSKDKATGDEVHQQGTKVHLLSLYNACEANDYKQILIKAGYAGKNKSNISVGDHFYYSGKQMYDTTQKEAFIHPTRGEEESDEDEDESERKRQARLIDYARSRAVVGTKKIDAIVRQLKAKIESKVSGGTGLRRSMFKMFDKNGTGEVDSDEFREVCFNLGAKLSHIEALALFGVCDVNGDGGMNYYEFIDTFLTEENAGQQRDASYYDID